MAKSCIVFENDGELDLRSINTFGASSKENKNPFGFFGTGLKYAIAILLRNNQGITILIGKDSYSFSKVTVKIRNDYFDIVTMDGEELSFSTDLGKTWDLWMAYRELYCNAMDENGRVYKSETMPEAKVGKTIVIIHGEEFNREHENRSSFILERSLAETVKGMELHHSESESIFYRGIKVGTFPGKKNSVFTYNIISSLDLTEDRTVKFSYEIPCKIADAIVDLDSPSLIRKAILSGDEFMESDINFAFSSPRDKFLDVAQSAIVNGEAVNDNVTAILRSRKVAAPPEISLNTVEEKQLARAIKFCNTISIMVEEFPICVVETLGKGQLGMAYDRKIFLSRSAFANGTKIVAGTLVEEYLHLKLGLLDETRRFQDHLLNMVISIGEINNGEPL